MTQIRLKDLLDESKMVSVQVAERSSGRPLSQATLQEALSQVEMLQAARNSR